MRPSMTRQRTPNINIFTAFVLFIDYRAARK
jgi:hypothetical protein